MVWQLSEYRPESHREVTVEFEERKALLFGRRVR
jgi:hypothetical protein